MMHALEQLTSGIAFAVIAGVWQGALLACVAGLVLRLHASASARTRHALLLGVFALALVLPWAHLPMLGDAVAHQPTHALHFAPWAAMLLASFWALAMLLRGGALLHSWRHLRRVRREATPLNLPAPEMACARDDIQICTSAAVDAPVVLGFLKPLLLLPEWMAPTLSSEELQQITLHECEHLRRRDDWLNLLLQLGLVLAPLNPALPWLNRRIGTERELACDEAVVARTAQPLAYAAALTRLAEQRIQRRSLRLALAAWGRRSELAQRVHALIELASGETRKTRRASHVALTAGSLAVLMLSAGLARMPQLVSFTGAAQPEQALATIVPPSAASARALTVSQPAMRLLPASFEVKPAASSKARQTRKRLHAQVMQQRASLQMPSTAEPTGTHFLRTAATQAEMLDATDVVQQDTSPARLITTEFSQPYLAVPVADGWLVIQL